MIADKIHTFVSQQDDHYLDNKKYWSWNNDEATDGRISIPIVGEFARIKTDTGMCNALIPTLDNAHASVCCSPYSLRYGFLLVDVNSHTFLWKQVTSCWGE